MGYFKILLLWVQIFAHSCYSTPSNKNWGPAPKDVSPQFAHPSKQFPKYLYRKFKKGTNREPVIPEDDESYTTDSTIYRLSLGLDLTEEEKSLFRKMQNMEDSSESRDWNIEMTTGQPMYYDRRMQTERFEFAADYDFMAKSEENYYKQPVYSTMSPESEEELNLKPRSTKRPRNMQGSRSLFFRNVKFDKEEATKVDKTSDGTKENPALKSSPYKNLLEISNFPRELAATPRKASQQEENENSNKHSFMVIPGNLQNEVSKQNLPLNSIPIENTSESTSSKRIFEEHPQNPESPTGHKTLNRNTQLRVEKDISNRLSEYSPDTGLQNTFKNKSAPLEHEISVKPFDMPALNKSETNFPSHSNISAHRENNNRGDLIQNTIPQANPAVSSISHEKQETNRHILDNHWLHTATMSPKSVETSPNTDIKPMNKETSKPVTNTYSWTTDSPISTSSKIGTPHHNLARSSGHFESTTTPASIDNLLRIQKPAIALEATIPAATNSPSATAFLPVAKTTHAVPHFRSMNLRSDLSSNIHTSTTPVSVTMASVQKSLSLPDVPQTTPPTYSMPVRTMLGMPNAERIPPPIMSRLSSFHKPISALPLSSTIISDMSLTTPKTATTTSPTTAIQQHFTARPFQALESPLTSSTQSPLHVISSLSSSPQQRPKQMDNTASSPHISWPFRLQPPNYKSATSHPNSIGSNNPSTHLTAPIANPQVSSTGEQTPPISSPAIIPLPINHSTQIQSEPKPQSESVNPSSITTTKLETPQLNPDNKQASGNEEVNSQIPQPATDSKPSWPVHKLSGLITKVIGGFSNFTVHTVTVTIGKHSNSTSKFSDYSVSWSS